MWHICNFGSGTDRISLLILLLLLLLFLLWQRSSKKSKALSFQIRLGWRLAEFFVKYYIRIDWQSRISYRMSYFQDGGHWRPPASRCCIRPPAARQLALLVWRYRSLYALQFLLLPESWAISQRWPHDAPIWVPWKFSGIPDYAHSYFSTNFYRAFLLSDAMQGRGEWVSSFLTAHQHIKGHSVP